ncbi:MAG: sulfurtransferase TusA family protein [Odoribacteraceae bacterium]|jgi:TusA-related sulfurtransferase|nr:sulfurtransferase TusA family protein [Odoribacteraceae bacterium]
MAIQELDVTRDRCPITFVKTRIALDKLLPGDVLRVRVSGDGPARNIPRSAAELGFAVRPVIPAGDDTYIIEIER